MKKITMLLMLLFLLSPRADACVGKTLHIGVLDSPEGKVFAEMISSLITERTGTSVKAQFYKSGQELYEAVRVKQVDILIENTTRAMQALNRPVMPDAKKAYDVAKAAYEKEKGLIWLKPYGFLKGSAGEAPSYTATLLRMEIINNFPALPRVMDKLASVISDDAYSKLLKSVEAGEKPKKVARDFLKSKKLI
jgi:glycine betaine/choline ABC-type transport system substrate-binding protein